MAEFTFQTQEQKDYQVAQEVFVRERECNASQKNIDTYTAILATLPTDAWPENLVQYAATPVEFIPGSVSLDDIRIIADYQYRDRLNILLRTEHMELNKVTRLKAIAAATLDAMDDTYAAGLVKQVIDNMAIARVFTPPVS